MTVEGSRRQGEEAECKEEAERKERNYHLQAKLETSIYPTANHCSFAKREATIHKNDYTCIAVGGGTLGWLIAIVNVN